MLSAEENERLMQVGPGTPAGELLRRYWHPVATSAELAANPVKGVRILGESLTLFRDRQGRLGLVAQRCAHRGVDLKHGIPEIEGLRCPYHGWMYDTAGQCVEQPGEAPEHRFEETVRLKSYPVQELGGLVWGYLGPRPEPLLPRWDLFVLDDVFRQVGTTMLPCNWLQCQENSVDTIHTEHLHGRFGAYVLERLGSTDERQVQRFRRVGRRHVKIDFERVPVGIQKYRLLEGEPEDAEGWRVGHPLVFPNYVRIGQLGYAEFQMRVPVDDTHTWHLGYQVFFPGPDAAAPRQDPVPAFEVPIEDMPDFVLGQDLMVWAAQGECVDRTAERLAASDRGILMFRDLLKEQIEVVRNGGDPMNTFRDPQDNQCIRLSMEDRGSMAHYQPGAVRYMNTGAHSPCVDELDALLTAAARKAGSRRS